MKAAEKGIVILLLCLLTGAFFGCVKQDAYLIYCQGEVLEASPTPAVTPVPTATPEVVSFPPITGDTFSMDEKGLPILDAENHYFQYYLVFTDIRIYEENGYTFLDGICSNSYSRPLTGGVRILFRDSSDGSVYGQGDVYTADGDMTLQPGENRIYAEILSEKDVQLMAFSLELTTPFTPVLNDTKK